VGGRSGSMSIETTLARISEIQGLLAPSAPATGGTPAPTAFASQLLQASAPAASAAMLPPAPAGGSGAGQAMVNLVRNEVGVAEQPPGSNDGPRIAQYRQATAGAGVGPWCAYFVSWVAQQAGSPIGPNGRGEGYVPSVWSWAKQAGRAVPVGQGQPQPGDLIVWSGHIGLVEAVLPGGRVQTIEGNSSDRVTRRVHSASSPLGYVRMG
jgi:cell wall-associated NlpC family hydrolase